MTTIRPFQAGDTQAVRGLIHALQAHERQLEASLAEPTEAFVDRCLAKLITDTQTDGIMLVAVDTGAVVGYTAGTGETAIDESSLYILALEIM